MSREPREGRTLHERIAYAKYMLHGAEQALRQAESRRANANALGGGIIGFGGSGNQSAARQQRSALEGALRAHKDASERVDYWSGKVTQLRAALSEAGRVRLGRNDLREATHVRTKFGWHKVAKVNAKTVSVETAYSWNDRFEFDKILEVRTLVKS